MPFKAHISVMPHAALLDPQGKAVTAGLHNLGLTNLEQVRVGKHITLIVNAQSAAEAHAKVEEACKQLLANPIMESYQFTVEAIA